MKNLNGEISIRKEERFEPIGRFKSLYERRTTYVASFVYRTVEHDGGGYKTNIKEVRGEGTELSQALEALSTHLLRLFFEPPPEAMAAEPASPSVAEPASPSGKEPRRESRWRRGR